MTLPTLIPWNPQAEQRDRRHQQLVSHLLNSLILQGVLVQNGFGWTITTSTSGSSGGGGSGVLPQRGADGNSWLTGAGPPSRLIGHVRDLYFDTVSGDVSQKQGVSPFEVKKWVVLANLRGGQPGKDGVNGVNGAQGLQGAPGPTGATGATGATGIGGLARTGQIASLPPPGNAGTVYYPTDAPYILEDNGFSWGAVGPIWPLTPMVPGSFTLANAGATGSAITNNGIVCISDTGGQGAADNVRLYTSTIPTAPYTVTMGSLPYITPGTNPQLGMVLYDGTKFIEFFIGRGSGTWQIGCFKYNSVTGFNSSYLSANQSSSVWFSMPWLRIQDDSTNYTFSISADGFNFAPFFTKARTDFLTATRIGVCLNNFGATAAQHGKLSVLSWLVTQP